MQEAGAAFFNLSSEEISLVFDLMSESAPVVSEASALELLGDGFGLDAAEAVPVDEADEPVEEPAKRAKYELVVPKRVRPQQEIELLVGAAMRRGKMRELNLYFPRSKSHLTVVLEEPLGFYFNGRKYTSLNFAARDLKMFLRDPAGFQPGRPDESVRANVWTMQLLDKTPLGEFCGRAAPSLPRTEASRARTEAKKAKKAERVARANVVPF